MARSVPLEAVHESNGATFTDFGGWSMPVEFDSIQEEHAQVRSAVGKFDVSHMGEIVVTGTEAEQLMQRLTTNDVSNLNIGDAHYSMITNENGIILDDTLVYRRDSNDYLFVPNAGHDAEMVDRWIDYRDEWGYDAAVENRTTDFAMIAVQGPEAVSLVESKSEASLDSLDWSQFVRTTIADVDALISHTGYTGEDGVEIITDWDMIQPVWETFDCQSCGLGARDTLRMEMGYLLSGQDFDPSENPRNPYEAGVEFTVDLETDFVGRDALASVAATGPDETFTGFIMEERGIARHGYPIESDTGDRIGAVTSGTMSPTLGEAIGLGYVPTDKAEPGTPIQISIRDEPKKAKIQAPPFIDR